MKLPTLPTQGPMRGLPRTSGSLSGLSLRSLFEALRRQRVAGDVGHDFRQIADAALRVDHAGLFAAGRAVANEFHGILYSLDAMLFTRIRGMLDLFQNAPGNAPPSISRFCPVM